MEESEEDEEEEEEGSGLDMVEVYIAIEGGAQLKPPTTTRGVTPSRSGRPTGTARRSKRPDCTPVESVARPELLESLPIHSSIKGAKRGRGSRLARRTW